MTLILTGIVLIGLCTFLGLIVTQYAYSRWQAQKLNDNFHLEGPVVKNVADNFPVLAKTSSVARQTFNQLTVNFNKHKNGQKISEAISNIITQLKLLGTNLVKFVKYLISLARPVEDSRHEVKVSKDASKSLFGFNSTAPKPRIIDDSTVSQNNIASPNVGWADIESDSHSQSNQTTRVFEDNINDMEDEVEDISSFATIGFASSSKPKAQTVDYEKEEQKILSRLQDSDLKDYAVWLELGDLYGKHEDYSKQRETYSFVLKNGQGKEKNMAMNKLIAMN